MDRIFLLFGALSALMSVAAGAFGAHALRGHLAPGMLAAFETGARYQMYHALALIAVAWLHDRWPEAPLISVAGWLFLAGILLFSGSLYLFALSGQRWLGVITPFGGLAFMAGWLCLVIVAWKS